MDFTLLGQAIGTAISIAFSGVVGALWAKKRYYHDDKEVKQGKSELSFIDSILSRAERMQEAADKAWTERNEVMTELGGLRAENVFLKEQVKNLTDRVIFLEQLALAAKSQRRLTDTDSHLTLDPQ